MSFRMRLALRGDLRGAVAADVKAGAGAVANVVRRKTNLVKRNIRREIESAGLGKRLANTIQGVAQPRRGGSLEASGVVFSKAWVKGARRRRVDIIHVMAEGAEGRARRGRFMAIPNDSIRQAARRGERPKLPSEFPQGTFVFLPNPPRLVYATAPDVVAFWLVQQTRLRPRIDPAARFDRAMRNFDELIVRKWERDAQRAFDRLR